MARYVIIALLSCFYVTGAVWFVQSQGQAYREELGRARQTEAAILRSRQVLRCNSRSSQR